MEFIAISLLNGISYGMVLFMLTTGLSLTLGLMGILNLAHGALYMVAAFVGWSLATQLGLNWVLALIIGTLTAGLVGLAIERGFLRHLYKLVDEQALLTIGFIYILTNISLWIWTGKSRLPYHPGLLSGTFQAAGMEYPIHRIATLAIGTILFFGLWWLQEKTRVGAIIRAGMDNREMVTGLGINLGRINYLVFFFSAILVGFTGVIGSMMMGPRLAMGWDILLLALIVLVVGGMGSVQGALLGAMIIGLVDAFGRALFPDLAMFFMYLVMILVLVFKPSGLLPRGV